MRGAGRPTARLPAIFALAAASAALLTRPFPPTAAFVVVPHPAYTATAAATIITPQRQSPMQQPRPAPLAAASASASGGGGGDSHDARKMKPNAFPPSPPNRRIREVCTAVVRDPTTGRYLALQRSKEVRSFQGHWHFISGGMEVGDGGDPVARAYRELEEEVQLLPQHVTLLARGRPLLVPSPRPGGKAILVHPVLFELAQPYTGPNLGRSVLNWENDDLRWTTLEDLRGLPLVPRLVETAERVLGVARRRERYGGGGEWPPDVWAAMEEIRADRTHGAMQLMEWAVRALGLWARAKIDDEEPSTSTSDRALEEELKDLGYALCSLRPSMAALANGVTDAIHTALTTTTTSTTPPLPTRLATAVAAFIDTDIPTRNKRLTDAAVRALVGLAKEWQQQDGVVFTVITLSLSSTLMAVFAGLKAAMAEAGMGPLRVIVCESRPLYEGARAAAALVEMGFEVTLITEAQMGLFAPKSHAALLGADALLGNLDDSPNLSTPMAINKAGSYPLTLCCCQAKVPVVVVSSDLKVTDQSLSSFELEEMAADEIVDGAVGALLGAAQGRVEIKNIYFEPIPLLLSPARAASDTITNNATPLVSTLVTEAGPIEGVEAIPMVVAQAQERRRRFEGLYYG